MTNRAENIKINPYPSKKVIKRMGYSDDQDGIMQRYINEEGNWNPHLANSKQFILDVVDTSHAKSIAILGSGWLLDVPMEKLMERCDKIFLYDIRHPKPILNRFRKTDKVVFVEMDITGGYIQYVYDCIKAKMYEKIYELPTMHFRPTEQVDMLVSINMLNQLDILIVEYLRRFPQINENQLKGLRQQIQLAHLNSLSADKSCLISDYEELLYDRTGSFVKKTSLIFNPLPEREMSREWVWKFDNRMSYYPNRLTHFKVRAIYL